MMDKIEKRIDAAARAFNEAASELAEAMLARLATDTTGMAAKVQQALSQGERMLIALEMHPETPAIWWSTIDDYQHMRRIMTIPGAMPSRH